MKVIVSPSLNPYFNLALEEVLFNIKSEDFVLLWRGTKSVVIGKNQNPFEETNLELLEELDIDLARRISGGGAVFHDKGNINYTIIKTIEKGQFIEYKDLVLPIKDFLTFQGIDTTITERNDMRFNEYKISGTSQYKRKNRVLHHGTLLFNADEKLLSLSLKPKKINYKSNSVKSVRSKIINIQEFLEEDISVEDFIEKMRKYLIKYYQANTFKLDQEIINDVNELSNNKYKTWEWIIGNTPKFKIDEKLNSEHGLYEINLSIREGFVSDIEINLDGEPINSDGIVNSKYPRDLIKNSYDEKLKYALRKII